MLPLYTDLITYLLITIRIVWLFLNIKKIHDNYCNISPFRVKFLYTLRGENL